MNLKTKLKSAKNLIVSYNAFNYAAQLSYGLMLAFLPTLMLVNWAINFLVSESDLSERVIEFLLDVLPSSFTDLILPALEKAPQLSLNFHSLAANIAIIVFVGYATARLNRLLMIISTNLARIKETRSIVKLWIDAVKNLFILLFWIGLLGYIYLLFQNWLSAILNYLKISEYSTGLILKLFLYSYLFITMTALLDWVYARFPARQINYKYTLPGALFTIIGWALLVYLTRFFENFISYEGLVLFFDQGMRIALTIYLISLFIVLGLMLNDYLFLKNPDGLPVFSAYRKKNEVV